MSQPGRRNGKQWRSWSDCSCWAVWSGSTLFAQTCLSENLGTLLYQSLLFKKGLDALRPYFDPSETQKAALCCIIQLFSWHFWQNHYFWNTVGIRATENRFFAGPDRFLVCKTDSVCIKRTFFGPKKHTLCILYWPNYLDLSSVKPLIVHNYSNYQCCQHIRVTESWKVRSHLITLPLAII